MHVLVQRDEVPIPEDVAALKVRRLESPDDVTVVDLLRRLRAANLLPNVPGGRATWLAVGERPLGVLTQEYREPWPLPGTSGRFAEVAGRLPRPHLELRYFAQRPPEDVFREFGGDPVRLTRAMFEASREITWSEAFRQFFAPRR